MSVAAEVELLKKKLLGANFFALLPGLRTLFD
jgi:hypothetical protein|nr:MAG: hypothetical protein [Lake Baikal virophage 4]